MRWIDVMNDVAFVVADLQERQRPDLAARFLTGYLEATGDYAGTRRPALLCRVPLDGAGESGAVSPASTRIA